MSAETNGKTVVNNVVCPFCGCVCDDLTVTLENGRITKTRNACALGRAWLLGHTAETDRPPALIDGQPDYTICFENYPVQVEHYMPHRELVPCGVG